MEFRKKNVLDVETVTVTGSATTLTATKYNATSAGATSQREYAFAGGHKASAAIVEVLAESIYYTLDGSTPTSTNGHAAAQGDRVVLENYAHVAKFKAIRQGSTSATVFVTYYKG